MSAVQVRHLNQVSHLKIDSVVPVRAKRAHADSRRKDDRLADLSGLASVDIETPLVADLSRELHALFDPVSDGTLPIYFGPLLGRLYLEGL